MTQRTPFPMTEADFSNDSRIAFDRSSEKWILEDNFDNSEWEWNAGVKKWVASLDEDLLERQRGAYVDVAEAGSQVSAEADPAGKTLKRKQNADGEQATGAATKRTKSNDDSAKSERKNTAVYVQNLPEDATSEELVAAFSKYGVIAENLENGTPRVKLYLDDTGKPKGDALVVYFRPESVNLAIQMLDDSDFRLGEVDKIKMRVTAADFSYKKDTQSRPEQAKGKNKKKLQKQAQKMKSKLTEWDDDDPSTMHQTSGRWDKVVIVKHMFSLKELEEDEDAATEIADDVKEEASKCGEVLNVTLFDKEPEGVLTVRFDNPQAAKACVNLMDGRRFAGAEVQAYISDGSERFKKTRRQSFGDDEDEKRLDEFGEWLERGGDDHPQAAIGEGGAEEIR